MGGEVWWVFFEQPEGEAKKRRCSASRNTATKERVVIGSVGAQSSSRKSGGVGGGDGEVGVGGKKTLSSEEARKREAADLEGGREMGVAVQ